MELESKKKQGKIGEAPRRNRSFRKQFFSWRSQKLIYLSELKTIHHQSFTILSPVYIRKYPMKIVNTSHQNLIKVAVENSYSVLLLLIRTISQTSSFTNITRIRARESSKNFSEIQNHTYKLLHKPAFIPRQIDNKSTKTPYGGHFRII